MFHQSGLQWYPRNCFEGPKAPFSPAFCQCNFRKCFWKETEMNCLQFTELAMMYRPYRPRMIVLMVFLFFISPRYLSNVWKNRKGTFFGSQTYIYYFSRYLTEKESLRTHYAFQCNNCPSWFKSQSIDRLFSKHVFPFTLIRSKQYFFPCTKYIGILFL